MSKQNMINILQEANEVNPIAQVNGTEVYSFGDAQKLNKADLVERKADGKPVELGNRQVSPDGMGYARSGVRHAAIDPEVYFDNRYRKIVPVASDEEGKSDRVKRVVPVIELVTDYRAIKEQSSGHIYTNNVVVYIIAKRGKEYTLEGTKTIGADEFINKFKNRLDVEGMMKLSDVLSKAAGGVKADKLDL